MLGSCWHCFKLSFTVFTSLSKIILYLEPTSTFKTPSCLLFLFKNLLFVLVHHFSFLHAVPLSNTSLFCNPSCFHLCFLICLVWLLLCCFVETHLSVFFSHVMLSKLSKVRVSFGCPSWALWCARVPQHYKIWIFLFCVHPKHPDHTSCDLPSCFLIQFWSFWGLLGTKPR